jgi:hypothetical protein
MTTTAHPQSLSLREIAGPLGAPFPPDEIKFLPKFPQQREDSWICLACPYADKRVYEERLNALAYGQWQTPPPIALATANRLIVFVTVILCGLSYTDVGEAFLSKVSRKGKAREGENTATAAYSQAFRRTCAQFGLGRYLYTLPKLWLPYDPQEWVIALSSEEKRQAVERLYRKAGLLTAESLHTTTRAEKPTGSTHGSQRSDSTPGQPSTEQEGENGHIGSDELAWVRKMLGNEPDRIARVCQHYRVETLELLTAAQSHHLVGRLLAQQAKPRSQI